MLKTIPNIPNIPNITKWILATAIALLLTAGALTATTLAGGPLGDLTAQVPENSTGGTSLGIPLQTTADPGAATYSLSGTDAALFSIDPLR